MLMPYFNNLYYLGFVLTAAHCLVDDLRLVFKEYLMIGTNYFGVDSCALGRRIDLARLQIVKS